MCLSIPAKILSINDDMAIASVNGVQLEVSLQLIEEVKEGDYVLVHTGYALQVLNDEDTKEVLKVQQQLEEG